MQIAQDDDAAVAAALLAGDQDVMSRIYQRWSPLVYSVALSTLDEVGAAEQVTEKVFVRVWTARNSFDPGRTRLSAWLIELTREQLAAGGLTSADAVSNGSVGVADQRASQPAEAATDQDNDRITDQTAEDPVRRLLLADEISRLDEGEREVLRLALFENLTHDEIAERTHLSADTVRKQIRHSLAMLRERLEVETDAH